MIVFANAGNVYKRFSVISLGRVCFIPALVLVLIGFHR